MLTSNSFQADPQPPRDSQADSDASINSFDGVRMDRMRGSAAVANQHTSTPTAESSYADGSLTLGKATPAAGKQAGASVPGSPGFPGLHGNSYPDS